VGEGRLYNISKLLGRGGGWWGRGGKVIQHIETKKLSLTDIKA